ncbi:MAG: class I SAM-dependent methyltransferase [Candidatus Izemoplasmatales bacterium]
MNLKDKLLLEEQKSFIGWDFSYLNGRVTEEPLNWDYKKIIMSYLKKTDRLLDMGTGGGEFLLTLNHPFYLTSVTEGYLPNLKLCKERLEPLGISVKHILNDKEIPYENQMFDIVINKHESYDLDEVYRILKPSGYFITQQVGGLNNVDLSEKLGCTRTIDKNHNLKKILKNLCTNK